MIPAPPRTLPPYARRPASQAVRRRMQLTLHATRRTPHGASRLVQAMSAWLVKTRRAPPRHCRDARVYGHTTTAMRDYEYNAPPSLLGPLLELQVSSPETAQSHQSSNVSVKLPHGRAVLESRLAYCVHAHPPSRKKCRHPFCFVLFLFSVTSEFLTATTTKSVSPRKRVKKKEKKTVTNVSA